MAGKPKDGVNWIAIEAEYRAGIKTPAEIGATHGVTRQAVNKRAKLNGWERNLHERIQMAVAEKVARTAAAEGQDVIEANANALATVELTQRQDIRNLREMVALLAEECRAQVKNPADFEKLGELMQKDDGEGTVDKLNELYRKVVSMPGRIQSVKQLAETLKILIELERKVLRMDQDTGQKNTSVDDLLRRIAQGA